MSIEKSLILWGGCKFLEGNDHPCLAQGDYYGVDRLPTDDQPGLISRPRERTRTHRVISSSSSLELVRAKEATEPLLALLDFRPISLMEFISQNSHSLRSLRSVSGVQTYHWSVLFNTLFFSGPEQGFTNWKN